MAVVIRLSRIGTKKKPFYRVTVACKEKPRDGNFLEVIGTFDPRSEAKGFQFKKERYDYWISKGAKPSRLVSDLVRRS